MESRIDKIGGLREKRYNCSQTVLCLYCDLVGVDEKTAYRIAEGMGGGVGGMRGICGAFTALAMLAGLKNSDGLPGQGKTKASTYDLVQSLAKEFESRVGSLDCKTLMEWGGEGKTYCPKAIQAAASLAEDRLFGQKG